MLRTFRKHLATFAATALIAGSAFAAGENWTSDFSAAKETAASQSKDLLLDFTGSDWCIWCKRLNEEVFTHDAFKEYAKENFVLVELDYPRVNNQSDAVKAQNEQLKNTYAIRGYPTILLTDAQGRPYAKTGYQRGGPDNYVEHLEELKQVRVNRDEQFAAAEKAQGVDKAKHLHEALKLVGDDIALQHYKPTIKQIIALDAEDKAGLKSHYEKLVEEQALRAKMQTILAGARADAPGAVTKLDEILAKDGLSKSMRQETLTQKSQIQLFIIKDKDAAKKTLLQAIEVDPESDMAEQLRGAVKRFFGEE